MMIGDVLFFKKENTFISKLIANITSSEYTHVGLIVAYDNMTGVATIIESDRFVKTRVSRVQLEDRHVVFTAGNLSDETRKKIVDHAFKSIGVSYDYLQIAGLFFSMLLRGKRCALFNSTNKLICSELIDLAYYSSGVKRISVENLGNIMPSELIKYYELKSFVKEV